MEHRAARVAGPRVQTRLRTATEGCHQHQCLAWPRSQPTEVQEPGAVIGAIRQGPSTEGAGVARELRASLTLTLTPASASALMCDMSHPGSLPQHPLLFLHPRTGQSPE